MIANNKLVKALRDAAARIEQEPTCYDWGRCESCNCGILAQFVMGVDVETLYYKLVISASLGTWRRSSAAAYAQCSRTGTPITEVYARLAECGLEKQDYENIEYLRSPAVLAITGPLQHDNPAHVAKYFRAQADLLEAQLAPAVKVEQPCVHMWMGGLCLYCCASQPIQKELHDAI